MVEAKKRSAPRGWRVRVLVAGLAVVPVVGGVLLLARSGGGRGGSSDETAQATLSLAETLGGADTVGYARALEPRSFGFPDDHGPHPEFRSEWWYFTGNLDGPDGRRFGFQFTLFRGALAPPGAASESPGREGRGGATAAEVAVTEADAWSTRQVYLGHFAVTDADGRRFSEFERYTRASAGLAGAQADPFRVWLDDWEVRAADPDRPAEDGARTDPAWPMTLRARDGDVGLEVRLTPRKPHVLQGDRGLSQKGPEAGNASYYYSYTRLGAEGRVTLDGEAVPVTGTAWLDREWSTSALSDGQVGWDWFALQLSDGTDLMVYQLRRADGSADPRSDGVRVGADGTPTHLSMGDFELTPTGEWTSPLDGSVYPSGWIVRVPGEGLELTVTPVLADQELDVSFRYWEGAVDVEGTTATGPVSGRGYVELTGYAGAETGPRAGEGR